MSPAERERAKELLVEAARLAAARRRAFIESADGSADAKAEAVALLATLDDPAFMSAPTGAGFNPSATVTPLPSEAPGSRIGRYKLLQSIGEGGFGTVFMADQTEPVHRRVALKIIKAGMDTKQVIARFEAERQALALMDHPNIARVLDAGATDQGRPFFVMELVRGEPVTRYCDQERLSIRQRLGLFRDICNAAEHAHQKGIIHRDLKPSNVLVTVADGEPLPKVIDFGIAKATASRLTDKTLFTEMHQLIGTPEYMSPEQAEVAGVDIDTRSDIYSLGVLLYELLAGSTPLDRSRLQSTPLAEIQRLIREEEPPRPSLRIAAMKSSGAQAWTPITNHTRASSAIEIAERRRSEPVQLTRAIRGDLDWIVMKCLEKDRARRYPTASALAEDIRRYLTDQPVSATPPSSRDRFSKFTRRNKRLVASLVVIFLTLVAATGVSLIFAFRAASARDRERRALAREIEQRERADREAAQTRAVADFQSNMLSGIDLEVMGTGIKEEIRQHVHSAVERQSISDDPQQPRRNVEEIDAELASFDRHIDWVRAADVARRVIDEFVLERAGQALEKEFAERPLVQADIKNAIGTNYRALGMYAKAETYLSAALELRRRTLGLEHEGIAQSLNNLGYLLQAKGDYPAAERMHRESLAMRRKLLGDEHPDVAESLDNVALLLKEKGELAAAEPLFRESLALRRRLLGEHPDVATGMNNLASLLRAKDDLNGAERLFRETLAMRQRLLGEEHPDVAGSLNNLAVVLKDKGDFDGAEAFQRQSLSLRRKLLGDEHPDVASSMANLAELLRAKGDLTQAEPLLRESLAMSRKLLGEEHPQVATSLNNLAGLLLAKGDFAAAEPLFRQTLALDRKLLGNDHPYVAGSMNNLAGVLKELGDYQGAEELFREALAIRRKRLGDTHSDTLHSIFNMGNILLAQGRSSEALELLAAAEPDARRGLTGANVYRLGRFLVTLGRARMAAGEYDAARSNLMESLTVLDNAKGATKQDRIDARKGLVELYELWSTVSSDPTLRAEADSWRAQLPETDDGG